MHGHGSRRSSKLFIESEQLKDRDTQSDPVGEKTELYVLQALSGDLRFEGFITKPWPSMLRTLWGDDDRYKAAYFSELPDLYFTGDGARRDADGYFWFIGRVDDVVSVAGHRLGTAEVESALVSEPRVAEAAVVGRPDDLKGTALVAFVTLKQGAVGTDAVKAALIAHVTKEIGAIARPDEIRFAAALPKTRSGKIMRRLLRDVCSQRCGKRTSSCCCATRFALERGCSVGHDSVAATGVKRARGTG